MNRRLYSFLSLEITEMYYLGENGFVVVGNNGRENGIILKAAHQAGDWRLRDENNIVFHL